MSAVVVHSTLASLVTQAAEARPLRVDLRYEERDPYAVRLVFPATNCLDGTETVWVFGRELLREGVHAPAGRGDVQLWPNGPRHTGLALHGVPGAALLHLDTAALLRFLDACDACVPRGTERVDSGTLERGLSDLLRGV